MRFTGLFALVVVLVLPPAGSPALAAGMGFMCDFPSGTVNTFENEVYQAAPAKPLAFEIGDVDLRGQKASLVTPKGKGELKIVRAIGANHYLVSHLKMASNTNLAPQNNSISQFAAA